VSAGKIGGDLTKRVPSFTHITVPQKKRSGKRTFVDQEEHDIVHDVALQENNGILERHCASSHTCFQRVERCSVTRAPPGLNDAPPLECSSRPGGREFELCFDVQGIQPHLNQNRLLGKRPHKDLAGREERFDEQLAIFLSGAGIAAKQNTKRCDRYMMVSITKNTHITRVQLNVQPRCGEFYPETTSIN
jgi:hypothetical protein